MIWSGGEPEWAETHPPGRTDLVPYPKLHCQRSSHVGQHGCAAAEKGVAAAGDHAVAEKGAAALADSYPTELAFHSHLVAAVGSLGKRPADRNRPPGCCADRQGRSLRKGEQSRPGKRTRGRLAEVSSRLSGAGSRLSGAGSRLAGAGSRLAGAGSLAGVGIAEGSFAEAGIGLAAEVGRRPAESSAEC